MKARNGSQFKIPLAHKYWLPDLHHYEVNTVTESKKEAAAEDRLGMFAGTSLPCDQEKCSSIGVSPYILVNCRTHKSAHICSLVVYIRCSPFLKAWLCSNDTRPVQTSSRDTSKDPYSGRVGGEHALSSEQGLLVAPQRGRAWRREPAGSSAHSHFICPLFPGRAFVTPDRPGRRRRAGAFATVTTPTSSTD